MSFIQRFLLGNRVDDDLQVGLFLKNDGTVWLRNPDRTETQVGGGGAAPDSRLAAQVATAQPNIDQGTGTIAAWQLFDGFPVGTDITLSEDGETIIVATAGVYAWTIAPGVDSFGSAHAATGFTVYLEQTVGTSLPNSPLFTQIGAQIDGTNGNADLALPCTWKCDAADEFQIRVQGNGPNGGSDFWNLEDGGLLLVARLS